jgi:hypothetical protein
VVQKDAYIYIYYIISYLLHIITFFGKQGLFFPRI